MISTDQARRSVLRLRRSLGGDLIEWPLELPIIVEIRDGGDLFVAHALPPGLPSAASAREPANCDTVPLALARP